MFPRCFRPTAVLNRLVMLRDREAVRAVHHRWVIGSLRRRVIREMTDESRQRIVGIHQHVSEAARDQHPHQSARLAA